MYNAQKYLEDNIRSLLTQSYDNFELIYVDDGSTDESAYIIKKYMKLDKRVDYLYQINKGAGVARNTGLEHAIGDYVIFLDSDDFFHRNLLRDTVSMSLKYDLDICITGAYVFNQKYGKYYDCYNAYFKGYIPKNKVFTVEECPENAFLISGSFAWNKLYNLKFLKENNLKFQHLSSINDLYFVFSSYVKAEKIAVCPNKLVYYRIGNSSGITANNDKTPQNIFYAYKAVKDMLIELEKWEMYQQGLCKMYFWDLFTALDRMRSYEKYVFFFNQIKDVYAPEFNLFQLGREYYIDDYLFAQANLIKNSDASEYMFETIKNYREIFQLEKDSANKMKFYFKNYMLQPKSNIVVYGFGDIGKDVVDQILADNYVYLTAIVDNNCSAKCYEGVDIIRWESIRKYEFDYILLAIWNSDTTAEIRNELIAEGIDDKTILNIRDYMPL